MKKVQDIVVVGNFGQLVVNSQVGGTQIQVNNEIAESVESLKKIKQQIKILETAEKALKEKITGFMGGKEELLNKNGTIIATYKLSSGYTALHEDTLKTMYPDIYKECLYKTEGHMRFIVK